MSLNKRSNLRKKVHKHSGCAMDTTVRARDATSCHFSFGSSSTTDVDCLL